MSEERESEALREVKCRREEREAADEASPSDWDLVEEAVEKKDWEVVRWVLRQGAIVEVNKRRGTDEKTLLHDACHGGDLETVKMLCQEMGADVALQRRYWPWAAVHFACDGRHVDIIRFLLTEGGVEVESRCGWGNRPVHVGAHSLPVLRCLVEEFGAEVEVGDDDEENPLLCAARGGDVSCLRYLLGRGARLDSKAGLPGYEKGVLHYAAEAESADALRFLVEECACDPLALADEEKGRLLEVAAGRDSLECLQYLAEECGVPLNEGGERNQRIMVMAAEGGAVEVAEWLVQRHGFSPNAPDRFGRLPLPTAITWRRVLMVQWLVQQCGVDVEVVDAYGRRAIHVAASLMNGLPMLRCLVEEGGADVNAQNNENYTALHVAASVGNMVCARYLVEEADADVFLESQFGWRPYRTASNRRHNEVAAFLRETEEIAQMRKNPE